MKINHVGLVKVFFKEKVFLPANFSYYNSSILDVKIVEPLSNLKKYFGFNWTAVNYTDTYIELQIKFENPLYISSGSLTEPDKLSV